MRSWDGRRHNAHGHVCERCGSFRVVDRVCLWGRFDLSVCYGSICDDFRFNEGWNMEKVPLM